MMDDHDMTHDEHIDPLPVEAPAALRALDVVVAPDRLRMAVAAAVADAERAQAPRRRTRRLRRGAFRLALAVAVPLVMIVVLSFEAQRIIQPHGGNGGTAAPSARDAATVALRQPTNPAPAASAGGETLTAHAGPIAFPTWTRVGWHAVGARTDTVAGHELRTVFYADAAGRRIGYAIADAQLPVAGGQLVVRRGAQLRVLDRGATSVVTWRRDGRTCVLAGRGVPVGRLLTLASYAA
jgi:hypothetical protein